MHTERFVYTSTYLGYTMLAAFGFNHRHKPIPKAMKLPLPYSTDAAHFSVGDRALIHHFVEGGIIENEVRWDAELPGKIFADLS